MSREANISGTGNFIYSGNLDDLALSMLPHSALFDIMLLNCGLTEDPNRMWVIICHSAMTEILQLAMGVEAKVFRLTTSAHPPLSQFPQNVAGMVE